MKKIFCWASLIDNSSLLELKQLIEVKKNYLIVKTMGKIPKEIYNDLSLKQRTNVTKWSKHVFRGDYLIRRSLRDIENLDSRIEIENLGKLNLNQDIKYKLSNARTLHHLGFYDSSIVTCGKVTDLILITNQD